MDTQIEKAYRYLPYCVMYVYFNKLVKIPISHNIVPKSAFWISALHLLVKHLEILDSEYAPFNRFFRLEKLSIFEYLAKKLTCLTVGIYCTVLY